MSTVDIKIKCPNGEKGGHPSGICTRHKLRASLRNVYKDPKDTDYKECHHKRGTTFTIRHLTYDKQALTIADDDEKYINLTTIHTDIEDISTYYSRVHDGGNEIERPLLLRIKDGGTYYLYENADAKGENELDAEEEERGPKPPINTKWRKIKEYGFYGGDGKPTEKLREQLIKLTCRLHDLHYVNIYNTTEYRCACSKTEVKEENGTEVPPGYTRYEHIYNTNPNSVRYNDTIIEWKSGKVNDDELFELSLNQIDSLFVYYWNEDKGYKRPLLMEVAVGGMKVPVVNDGNDANDQWTMILDENGEPKILTSDELPLKLKELTCKLFRQDVTNGDYKLAEELSKLNCECLQEFTQKPKALEQLSQAQPRSDSEGHDDELDNASVDVEPEETPAPLKLQAEPTEQRTGGVPAADLSDQVPDTESETKILLQGTTYPPEVPPQFEEDIGYIEGRVTQLSGSPITDSVSPTLSLPRVVPKGYHIPFVSIDPPPLPAAPVRGPHPISLHTEYLDPPPPLASVVRGDVIKARVDSKGGVSPILTHPTDVQGFPIAHSVTYGSGVILDEDVYNTIEHTIHGYASKAEEWDDTPTVIFDTDKIYETVPGGAPERGEQVVSALFQPQLDETSPETQHNADTQADDPRGLYTVGITPIPNKPGEYKARLSNGSEVLVTVHAGQLVSAVAAPPPPEDPQQTSHHPGNNGESSAPGSTRSQEGSGGTGTSVLKAKQELKQSLESHSEVNPDGELRSVQVEPVTEEKLEECEASDDKGGPTEGYQEVASDRYVKTIISEKEEKETDPAASGTAKGTSETDDGADESASPTAGGTPSAYTTAAASTGSSLPTEPDGPQIDAASDPESTVESQPPEEALARSALDSGLGPGPSPGLIPGSNPSLGKPTNPGIAIGVPTGILVTSALACFAGWKLYNRYKGDPWVRQI